MPEGADARYPPAVIECTWCGSAYEKHQLRCDNCGGPLPPLPGASAGEPPPPAPRTVPAPFERRIRYTSNASFMAGAILAGVGVIQGIAFTGIGAAIRLKPFLYIGPGIFVLLGGLGLLFLRHARRKAEGTLRAFREGTAVVGEIAEVYSDTSIKVNGRSPWAIVYNFAAGGRTVEGKAQSWDASAQDRRRGQPVHVLYVAADPAQNTLWPPLK